jgi:hypothetical protein
MSTSNEVETIHMIKLSRHLVTEEPAGATWRNSPRVYVLRIAPNQVTESAFVRNLLGASNDSNLVYSTDLRAQTTVNAQNLAINDSSEDKEIENLAARLPDRRVTVLLLALLVESIDLGNLSGFVVASNKSDPVRVPSSC